MYDSNNTFLRLKTSYFRDNSATPSRAPIDKQVSDLDVELRLPIEQPQ